MYDIQMKNKTRKNKLKKYKKYKKGGGTHRRRSHRRSHHRSHRRSHRRSHTPHNEHQHTTFKNLNLLPPQKNIVIIGLIKADWCSHCENLMKIWNDMCAKCNDNAFFFVIDEKNEMPEIEIINNKLFQNSSTKLTKSNGFPNLFKIKNNQIEYYTDKRELNELVNWVNK